MALGSLREIRQEATSVITTDATTTSVWEYDTSGGPGSGGGGGTAGVYTVKLNCVGHQSVGPAIVYEARASFRNTGGGGGMVQIGTTTGLAVHKDTAAAAWTIVFDISGEIIRVRVTGAAATTIHWLADATVMMYEV